MTKDKTIEEITQRLIEFYRPVRIYLFRSAARGDSCRSIRQQFWGLHTPVDVVRLPFSDFEARAAHVVASLPATVVREGKLLYDAARIAA